MAGAAEVGGAVERLHDGGAVPVEVGEDFGVGNLTVNGLACFVDERSGGCQDIAAGAAAVDRLDGMADGAGDAVVVGGTLLRGTLGEGSGEHGERIVAALAVAGVFVALLRHQEVDVLLVPGGAEGVGVGGLTPLLVGFLVAVATVVGVGKGFGVEELARVGGGVRGQEGMILAKLEVVGCGDFLAEDVADGNRVLAGLRSADGQEMGGGHGKTEMPERMQRVRAGGDASACTWLMQHRRAGSALRRCPGPR